jgi:hypothetical protein
MLTMKTLWLAGAAAIGALSQFCVNSGVCAGLL